jgi:hypothetical protein
MNIKQEDKKILYPIFEECAQLTLDPYWQQIFTECARGKLPKGSSIDHEGEIIYFKNKFNINKNYVSYRLGKNPEIIFKDLKTMFQEHLNIKSNKDRQEQRDELDDMCKDLQESYGESWQKIKRKKIKEPIIRRYILDLKEMYSLSNVETAQVAQLIRLGFLLNWITNVDVVYENQRIVDINTLHFDTDERLFSIDIPSIQYKREYKNKLPSLSQFWEKHLEKPKNCYIL